MKVNLLLDNPGDVRSGYLNIDAFAPPGDRERVKGDVYILDDHVDGGELEELVAHEVLDYVPLKDAGSVIDGWLSKLAHKGRITISVVDLREVCRAVLAGTVDLNTANQLLHGEQRRGWDKKRLSFTASVLSDILSQKGLKILSRKVTNHRAVVTAERL